MNKYKNLYIGETQLNNKKVIGYLIGDYFMYIIPVNKAQKLLSGYNEITLTVEAIRVMEKSIEKLPDLEYWQLKEMLDELEDETS